MSLEEQVQSMVNEAVAAAQGEQPDPLTTENVESIVTDVLNDFDVGDHIDIDSHVENALCNMCLEDYVDIEQGVYSGIVNFIYEGCGEMDDAGAHIMKRGAARMNARNEWRILTYQEYNQVVNALAKFRDDGCCDNAELQNELQELRDLNAGAQLDIGELQDQVNALLQVINIPPVLTDEDVVNQTVNHFGTPQAFNAKVLEMAEVVRAPLMALTKADLVGLAANTGTSIDKWGRKDDIIDALLAAGVDLG
tara:strand:+ start:2759 stop:3511 length:753 start_codon:yes stop_codon:yes gene_type:complete